MAAGRTFQFHDNGANSRRVMWYDQKLQSSHKINCWFWCFHGNFIEEIHNIEIEDMALLLNNWVIHPGKISVAVSIQILFAISSKIFYKPVPCLTQFKPPRSDLCACLIPHLSVTEEGWATSCRGHKKARGLRNARKPLGVVVLGWNLSTWQQLSYMSFDDRSRLILYDFVTNK